MFTIYLSGGIKGLTDVQAFGWRTAVREHYRTKPVTVIIPTRIQERQDLSRKENADWICKRDKVAISKADLILAYCPVPSWGTAMELVLAHDVLYKWVVTVNDEKDPSLWLVAHSDVIVPDFESAYRTIDEVVWGMQELVT